MAVDGFDMCLLHLQFARASPNSRCGATSATGRPCPQRHAHGLTRCPFHVDASALATWISTERAREAEAVQAAAEHRLQEQAEAASLVALRPDLEPLAPPPAMIDALAELHDPDAEDDLLRSAELWLAEAASFRPAAPLPFPTTFAELRTFIGARGPAAHPLSLLAWKQATLSGHARALRAIAADSTPQLQSLGVVRGLLQHLSHRRTTKRWKWSTMLRVMAETQGALKNLDVARGIPALLLSRSAAWCSAIKGVAARARSELPRVPKAASPRQVLAAIAQEPSVNTRRLLALTWLACGRTGDIRQLTAADVVITADGDATSATVTITFRAGKTVARRGPFSLHTRLLADWLAPLQFASWAEAIDTSSWVPHLRNSTTQDVLRALRRIDPSRIVASAGVLCNASPTAAYQRRYLSSSADTRRCPR
jgi:hypothetical protein